MNEITKMSKNDKTTAGGGYKSLLIVLLFDIIVAVSIFYGLYEYLHDSIENIVTNVHGPFDENSFSYFTTLSNLYLFFVCLISIPYSIISLIKRKDILPKWLVILKFIAVVCIVITFLIVNLVLVWLVTEPYELYEGKELFTHVIVPVASLLSFLIYKPKFKFKREIILFTNIPILIYAILYMLMVFILKIWSDFYSVAVWYPYSLVIFMVLFFGLSSMISFLLYKIKNKQNKN